VRYRTLDSRGGAHFLLFLRATSKSAHADGRVYTSLRGFGILLMLCLNVRGVLQSALGRPAGRIGDGLAYVGMHSYSVYVWHVAINSWFVGFVHRVLHFAMDSHVRDLLYMLVTSLSEF